MPSTDPAIMLIIGLTPDTGECEDRRNRSKVDCSQVIFILATNALDQDIQNFCQQNADIFSEQDQQRQKLAKELSKILRQGFLQRFGVSKTHIALKCNRILTVMTGRRLSPAVYQTSSPSCRSRPLNRPR